MRHGTSPATPDFSITTLLALMQQELQMIFALRVFVVAIAAISLAKPHIQVVIVGSGEQADQLAATAIAPLALNKTVIRLTENEVIPQNLPPALAETLPKLPEGGAAKAVICAGFACRQPISDSGELGKELREAIKASC